MIVVTELTKSHKPLTYKEAISCLVKTFWIQAMKNEIESLNENLTWVNEELPSDMKTIPCKWIYKKMHKLDGSVDKFKARLLIKVYSKRKGENYDETFSPVAKSYTIGALLSIAASREMGLTQLDITAVFLQFNLEEEI